jgi:hypothetical protein
MCSSLALKFQYAPPTFRKEKADGGSSFVDAKIAVHSASKRGHECSRDSGPGRSPSQLLCGR